MKIGIMSMAHPHGEAYLSHLKAMDGVEILGLADDNPDRCRRYAAMFGVKAFDSYRELLAGGPDAVVICSENSRHRLHVEMAVEAGCAILCEKPIATNPGDALAIVELCERRNVPFMTAFPMRYSPPTREAARFVQSGGLGRILCVNGRNPGQMPGVHSPWFIDKALSGGGAVTDHTVHLADLYRWILDTDVERVFARSNRILHAPTAGVETGGFLMLEFANGSFASIDCSWSRPVNNPTWGGLTMEFVGSDGVLNLDAFSQNLEIHGGRQRHSILHSWGSDMNRLMLERFLQDLDSGTSPVLGALDGCRAVQVVHAAYRSIDSGRAEMV